MNRFGEIARKLLQSQGQGTATNPEQPTYAAPPEAAPPGPVPQWQQPRIFGGRPQSQYQSVRPPDQAGGMEQTYGPGGAPAPGPYGASRPVRVQGTAPANPYYAPPPGYQPQGPYPQGGQPQGFYPGQGNQGPYPPQGPQGGAYGPGYQQPPYPPQNYPVQQQGGGLLGGMGGGLLSGLAGGLAGNAIGNALFGNHDGDGNTQPREEIVNNYYGQSPQDMQAGQGAGGAGPYDPNAAGYDPNAPYDPSAGYDPNAGFDQTGNAMGAGMDTSGIDNSGWGGDMSDNGGWGGDAGGSDPGGDGGGW